MEHPAGAEIERYVVVRRLGAGGNGVVYLARHRELGTSHALKLLRWSGASDERLRREGRLQATLDHPNVARVTDTVRIGDQLGLVMEYVDGPTLSALLAGGRVPIEEVDALVRGILEGVAAAHDRGWVHRDLKPANVLLSAGGVPKITDFGLARILGDEEPGVGTTTRGGLGTRGYMSLEQTSGAAASPEMDVFALGAVMFEIIEGSPAFPTVNDWLKAIRSGRYPTPSRSDLPDRHRNAVRYALCDLSIRVRDARTLLGLWDGGPPPTLGVGPTMSPLSASGPIAAVATPLPDRHQVPAERDRFVGRDQDLLELRSCLLGSERLVTIHGPGGIGKTRLAIRSAWTRLSGRERVWFCDLSGASGFDGLLHSVAQALGLQLENADPAGQIGAALAEHGRCLVVLDNFEQVVHHAGETVGRWMDVAPDVLFLVTSRIVLGVTGERLIRLEPLDEPAATALFVDRAAAARRDFDAAAFGPPIRELVRCLDGMPLAIELAAARIRVLTPPEILERIGDRFRLLTGGHGRPDRQATLRATIGWSWDLLDPWERSALAQLSVFAGGFTVQATEAVVDLSPWPDVWVVDVLQALVDQSLVRPDRRRFDLLGAIHDFAAGQLEPRARTEAERRHGQWAVRQAEDGTSSHAGRPELANLLLASERALARGDREIAEAAGVAAADVLVHDGPIDAAIALLGSLLPAVAGSPREGRIAAVLADALQASGRIDEALAMFEAALVADRARGDRRTEADTLSRIASVRYVRGQRELALTLHEEALAIYREVGARVREGAELSDLGVTLVNLGRHAEAEARYREALTLQREVGDAAGMAVTLSNLGVMHSRRGRTLEAVAVLEEALAAAIGAGDRRNAAFTHANLGAMMQTVGRGAEARVHADAAMEMATAIGDARLIGAAFAAQAMLSEEGTTEAEALFAAALEPFRAAGDPRMEGLLLTYVGRSRMAAGQTQEARTAYDRALELLAAVGDAPAQGNVQGDLGVLHLAAGDREAALEAFDRAEGLVREGGNLHDLATVLCRRAEAQSKAGEHAAARASLAEARALFTSLGLPPESALAASVARADKIVLVS